MQLVPLEPIESVAFCSAVSAATKGCKEGTAIGVPANATGYVTIGGINFPLRMPSTPEQHAILLALAGNIPADPTVLPDEGAFPSAAAHAAARDIEVEQAKLTAPAFTAALALRGMAFFWWQFVDDIAVRFLGGDHRKALKMLREKSLGSYPSAILAYVAPPDLGYGMFPDGTPHISRLGLAYQTALHGLVNVATHPGTFGLTVSPSITIGGLPLVLAGEQPVATWSADERDAVLMTTKLASSKAPQIVFALLYQPQLDKLSGDSSVGDVIVAALANMVETHSIVEKQLQIGGGPKPPIFVPPIDLLPGGGGPGPLPAPPGPVTPTPPVVAPPVTTTPPVTPPAPPETTTEPEKRNSRVWMTIGVLGAVAVAGVAGVAWWMSGGMGASKPEPEPEEPTEDQG